MFDDTTPKVCKQCGQSFPATKQYFFEAKGANGKTYLRGKCKDCYCAETRAEHARRFAENPDKIRAQRKAWNDAHPDDLKVYSRRYYHNNKETEIARARVWKKGNPEKTKVQDHKGYVKYHANHPEVFKARRAKRRSLEANAPGTHTAADIRALYEEQNGLCAYCGIRLFDDYHVDHVTPISRGGGNGIDNILLACPDCNLSKNDKTFAEWKEVRGW